jgi:hypothetical protein
MLAHIQETDQMKYLTFCLVIVISVLGCSSVPRVTLQTSENFKECDAKFEYEGKPIQPDIIERFEGWLSDAGPIVISLDLSAASGSDEYSAGYKMQDGYVVMNAHDTSSKRVYKYQWLGRTSNGVHVVRTCKSGGGTGLWTNLLLFRFRPIERFVTDKSFQDRIGLIIVGEFALGDRDNGKIEISGDHIIIGKSKYRNADTILTTTSGQ